MAGGAGRPDAHHHVLPVEIFPDAFGNAEEGTGLVKGSQLRLGENSTAITRTLTGCAEDPKELKFTLMVSYTAM